MSAKCNHDVASQSDDSAQDVKRPQFGTRYLTDANDVFKHNAWDNVEWDEEQEEDARNIIKKQLEVIVPEEMTLKYEADADSYWNAFYSQHDNRFFKDRHWLFTEFPELLHTCSSGDGGNLSMRATAPFNILEVGCGAGNTIFPILQANKDCPDLFVYACDFSSTAVDIVKKHPLYDASRCKAFVCDITALPPPAAADSSQQSPPTSTPPQLPFPAASLDIIIMIFVLSAIHPDKMQSCINALSSYLKPGGVLLFRDYGRYDLAQLRFKNGRCLSDNFYVRGDGTRCYFFTQDELEALLGNAGGAGLVRVQNAVDRRLQVNRGRRLKMYRVWCQCKYRKPAVGEAATQSTAGGL